MKSIINFFEIPAIHIERAVKFYNNILNLKLEIWECGDEKMAFFPGSETGVFGAISQAKDFNPSSNGVLIHFDVDCDVNEVLERIVKNNGKIIRQKTKIEVEGKGHFALFIDSEGNRLGVYSDK